MSVDTDKRSATRAAVNAANAITVARILLIPVFVVLLLSDIPYGQYLAIAVFAVAAFTDKLDGYVARSRGQITAVGQFLDPLADKLLISAALIALVGLGKLSAWVAMVIIAREFAVSPAARGGHRPGRLHTGELPREGQDHEPDRGHHHPHVAARPLDLDHLGRGDRGRGHGGAHPHLRRAVLREGSRQPALAGHREMTRPAAAVLLTGSELLDGRTRDRNGYYLGAALSARGFAVSHVLVSPDDPDGLRRDLRFLLDERPAVLVISGGLGTTHDDLTAETVAAVTDRPLADDPAAVRMVTDATRRVATRRGLELEGCCPRWRARHACPPAAERSSRPASPPAS